MFIIDPKTFKNNFLAFISPLNYICDKKLLKIDISDNISGEGIDTESFCTDLDLYKSIVYHILQNAIKFSSAGSAINIKFSWKSFCEIHKNISHEDS
jgi:signal transduction histidine kinase